MDWRSRGEDCTHLRETGRRPMAYRHGSQMGIRSANWSQRSSPNTHPTSTPNAPIASYAPHFLPGKHVRDAPTDDVIEAVRSGGLAQQKAERIQQILRILTERLDGAPLTLDALETTSLDDALRWLRGLPGVGRKLRHAFCYFTGQASFSGGYPCLASDETARTHRPTGVRRKRA